ncbi:MAG: RluA family pseudouridine synthase [bacterium]|nr:RluA family pseudouridine synthase [bacterium]
MRFRPPDLRHRPLSILHQETSLVVIDKMPDFLSVPGRDADMDDCVVARVRELFPAATGSLAAHRLDMETSGLMVLGLTPEAHRHLSLQFEQRRVHKTYVALVEGHVEADRGHIELAFRVDLDDRPRQMLDAVHGKLGITDWEVLERHAHATRLRFTPRTGRTHQLRVHAAHPDGLGHPIIGDRLYGTPGERLMLHSTSLAFHHPLDEAPLQFEIPVPF